MLTHKSALPIEYRAIFTMLIALYFCFNTSSFATPKSPVSLTVDGLSINPNECASTRPEWVFCSGFEEGNKNIWDDWDGNPDSTNQLITDSGPFNLQNNTVMRIIAPSTSRGGADIIKVLPDSYDKLYMRWYMKWENGYDFSVMNHVGGGMGAGDRSRLGQSNYKPDGTWFWSLMEVNRETQIFNAYTYSRGMYMDCAIDGQCYGDLFPCTLDEGSNYCTKPEYREQVNQDIIISDKWYCIEKMIDSGTPTLNSTDANGVLDFWIDDKHVGPWEKIWFRTTPETKINTIWLNVFFHGDHLPAGVQYDNLVVSTKRIGCR